MKVSYRLQKFFEEEKANGKANAQAVFYGIGNARERAKRYGIICKGIKTCLINDILWLWK